MATVKGDIHDIGKNIVRVLLENYGYRVIDLGKDVEPAAVVRAAQEHNAPLVGLSADFYAKDAKQSVDIARQVINA